MVVLLCADEHHVVVGADGAVHDAEIADDATERIENGVEHQGLQWSRRVAFGCGETVDDGAQHFGDAHSSLGTA